VIRSGCRRHDGGLTRTEAEDVAAQDQGFIGAQYYWQWLADYVVNKGFPL
jgi:hypothetical protein